jgi:NosR/NirI family nitrous oxide reductase transcriptional regulator
MWALKILIRITTMSNAVSGYCKFSESNNYLFFQFKALVFQFKALVFQFKASVLQIIALVFVCLFSSFCVAQPSLPVTPELMLEVFPKASRFSEKSGSPPVITAYADSVDGEVVVGYLFETKDYPPEEVGYSAPIEVMAGLDMSGSVTGIKVLFYRESYRSIRGDFLATENFPNQFTGKNVTDGFRVGRDIDGVSRATITSWALSRGVRNASREVAQVYLPDFASANGKNNESYALAQLGAKSWQDLKAENFVAQLIVPQSDGTQLELSFVFIGNDGLGELILGVGDYSGADREASSRVSEGNLVVVGIDGDTQVPFRQERLAIEQGAERFRVSRNRFVYAGSADEGLIADQVRYAGALVLASEIDLNLPFSILYDMSEDLGSFDSFVETDYQISALALALSTGSSIPVEYLPTVGDVFESDVAGGVLANLFFNAPWLEVIALLVLLVLVSTAFFLKQVTIRWVALSVTLVYLGFVDGGFVSVSHITNGLKLGPSMFLNDLPLLLIVSFTVITTLFWGRVFCSSLCPFGALQDVITRLLPRNFQLKVPQRIHDVAIYAKYAVLVFLIAMALTFSEQSLFQYFEPFGTIFYFSQSLVLWLILLAFIVGAAFVPRFYCRYACPLGAALGVASILSPFKIKRVEQCQVCKVCEHSCPTGAIRGAEIDFKECVRCDICEIKLIDKAGVCKHDIDVVKNRVKKWQPITVGAH